MSMSKSPDENLLDDANEAHAELERRLSTIITAWEADGALKQELREQWPALADAIDNVCVLDSLDKANDEITITTDVRDWHGLPVQTTITRSQHTGAAFLKAGPTA